MAGKPRFFCENCGAEVPLEAKLCPGCGRFFESVRCPRCGFSGSESKFANGCPRCGYRPGRRGKKSRSGDAFPFWVWLVLAALATAVFAALFLVLM